MENEYRIEEPKKSKIKILSLLLVLAAVLIVAFVIYFVTKVNKATSSVSVPVNLTIEKGSNTRHVAAQLSEKEIVTHAWIFTVYIYLKGAGNKIQAGEYLLDRKMSIKEVTQALTAGKVVSNELRITIIEGWTNKQIGNYLEQRSIATAVEFDASLKLDHKFKYTQDAKKFGYLGFLFPDTYTLSKQSKVDALIPIMLVNFESKVTEKMVSDIKASGRNLSDVIILASIIEKEVGRNKPKISDADLQAMQKERELVASVFYNRLAVGVALQSDATVNYVTGKQDRQVSLEDAKTKSPYNTYLYRGLTPGPISNPGLGAIKAAIYPADSDYLYFLNKEDGEAVFSKTLDEHNQNKAKYLK